MDIRKELEIESLKIDLKKLKEDFNDFKKYQHEPLEKMIIERKENGLSIEDIELSFSESYRIFKTYEGEIKELEKKIENKTNPSWFSFWK